MPVNVLLVDDSYEILEALEIQYRGVPEVGDIWMATSPQEAWTLLKKESVDMVSLDIQMGPDDGLQLCGNIRNAFPNVFIVMCSLEATDANQATATQQGANYFLEKPLGFRDLRKLFNTYRRDSTHKVGCEETVSLETLMELVSHAMKE